MSSSTKKESKTEIVVRGTAPILKYDLKKDGWIATVFIDDEQGDLVIQFDSRKFFGHWWRQNPLRKFLAGAGEGYIADKLSYGLDRWDGHLAINNLYKMCTEKWGHIDGWPYEVAEMAESMEDDLSADAFAARLHFCEEFNKAFDPHDYPNGELGANQYVSRFIALFWGDLVDQWKMELSSNHATVTDNGGFVLLTVSIEGETLVQKE